jgi:hypothetical protein
MSARVWLVAVSILLAVPCAAQTPAAQTPPAMPAPQVTPTPPDFPRGRISGYAFGDYYYNVAGDPTHHYSAAGSDSDKVNIDNSTAQQIGKDLNGFQIRRIYFQLDNDLSIKYSTRFRLEADSKSLTSDAKIGVAVRTAYLQVRDIYPRADLFLGLIATPIWENPEDFWQYRSIEKTIADFRGLGSSMDEGLELKGFADSDHRFGYSAMVGNGPGQKPEDNRYKKGMLALPIHIGDLRLEPFVDYEDGAGGRDRATYKGFAGYEFRRSAIGVEVVDRVNHTPTGNQEPFGFSVFARATPYATLAGFARFDLWQPDRRLDNRVDSQLWIAGLDWQPFKDVHFMPNVEATQFDAKGTAVAPAHHDLQARVTFYYRFAKPNS